MNILKILLKTICGVLTHVIQPGLQDLKGFCMSVIAVMFRALFYAFYTAPIPSCHIPIERVRLTEHLSGVGFCTCTAITAHAQTFLDPNDTRLMALA